MPPESVLGLEPLFSQRELHFNVDDDLNSIGGSKLTPRFSGDSKITPRFSHNPSGRITPQPDISHNGKPISRASSIRSVGSVNSVGAASVNSRNVRFQSVDQAQRALQVTNALQRQDSHSSRSSIASHASVSSLRKFKKKKNKARLARGLSGIGLLGSNADKDRKHLLARISSTVPFGFDPSRRRGSIIKSHRQLPAVGDNKNEDTQALKTRGSEEMETDQRRQSEEIGRKRRESKELIGNFSPTMTSTKPNGFNPQEIKQEDLEPQYKEENEDIPDPLINLKFHFFVTTYFSVLIVIYMINYRLFSDQDDSLLYPMSNIGAKIMSVFTEPYFIISILGAILVVHTKYIPQKELIEKKRRMWLGVFIIANILNILRVSISSCSMDFIYNLYLYLIILATMMVPLFTTNDRWKQSETILLLFIFWIGVILIGFVNLVIHEYFPTFIFFVCYIIFVSWIIRFFYYKSLGVFDKMGNLSSTFDIGYCALLIPGLLLFPYFGGGIIIKLTQINNVSYSVISIYGYYILLKITFWFVRGLWESTALKGTDERKYIHLMFPIFFIEELIDVILLIKLKFSWEIIGLLLLFALNHIIRDSDVGFYLFYKKWAIPCITKLYYAFYHRNALRKDKMLLRSQSEQPDLQQDLNKTIQNGGNHNNNNNGNNCDDEEQQPLERDLTESSPGVTPESAANDDDDDDEEPEVVELDVNTMEVIIKNASPSPSSPEMTKEINLAQETEHTHLARVYVHFKMLTFVEYVSRFTVFLLIVMDIICDEIQIGNRLLTVENGIIGEENRGLLILLLFISLIEIFITQIISLRLLSRTVVISLEFFTKIENINDFTLKERLHILAWIILGNECEVFFQYWKFFAFVIGYQSIMILQAFFTNNGLVSICNVFF